MTTSNDSSGEVEHVLAQFGGLFVTESRVREQGTDGLRSAFLHEVNAVGTRRIHYPWLLALVAIGLIVAAAGGSKEPAVTGLAALVGIGAGLIYAATREVSLAVCAGSMTLKTTLKGKATAESEEFIEALEEAKLAWEAQNRR